MWLKRNIVMLPTNVSKRYNCTEGLIVKCVKSWTPIGETPREIDKLSISKNWSKGVLDYYEAQNLYIVSDEEIKEDDWVYNSISNELEKWSYKGWIEAPDFEYLGYYKIIATTDISLKIKCDECKAWENRNDVSYTCTCKSLPQPSQQFIEKFIGEYNKGNQIEEIFVKYIQELSIDSGGQLIEEEVYLKINSDNTISIRSKINWSVEEVEEILRKCAFHFITNPPSNSENILQVSNQWIKENL